jgi:hypothetical protein
MGRPLNKKYFGDRNIGTGGYQINGGLSNSRNYADDRIGGEGVDSVTVSNIGAYLERIPSVTFKAPSIPGGVTATGTVTNVAAVKATINNTGSGYQYGNQFTVNGGTGTAATFSVSSLITVTTTLNNGGSAVDNGDEYEFSGSYSGGTWTVPLKVRITNAVAGVVQPGGYTVITPGVWTGSTGPNNTGGAIRTQTAAGQDFNGTGLIINITSWGANSVALVNGGNYTAVNAGPTLMDTVTGTGSGCYTDVYYGVSAISITEKGSGYISVADALPTFSTAPAGGEVRATGAAVLKVDAGGYINTSGDNMNANNQENAILMYAKTTSGGTAQLSDIIKQSNARSYKVKTADGIAICKLVASASPAVNQAYLVATATGGTYYVTKLTAHRATLVAKTGDEALDGMSVQWTFGSPTATIVQIANA